jgi:hypothetical protein
MEIRAPQQGTEAASPFHYGWVVAALTFLVLLVSAGVRV